MITFIIPNRGGKNIDFVISKISRMYPTSKFIVISQEDNWLFRRGQLFNIAVKYVETDYICLHDNDIFFPEYIDFEGMFESSHVPIRPFASITQVSLERGTYRTLSTGNHCGKGGSVFLSTEMFKKVNGFSNLYCGWGYEDNDFCTRCGDNFMSLPNTIYHIRHAHGYKDNLHVELNRIFRGLRLPASDDGFEDTTCDVVYERVSGNIKYIGVKNISVRQGYKYADYLKLHGNANLGFRFICEHELKSTISNDYVLIGVPKHMNFGDTLLWSAADQLLGSTGHMCLGHHFSGDLDLKEVNPDTVIVFNGGGFLNDIWSTVPYVCSILEKYKDNKIVFLPNSVYFSSDARMKKLEAAVKFHRGGIVMYTREKQSYDRASAMFAALEMVDVAMLPDIAMGYDIDSFISKHRDEIIKSNTKNTLYISRKDAEKVQYKDVCADLSSDWPMLKSRPKYCDCSISADEWLKTVRDRLTVDAINFIMPYKTVYSDRMHGAILAWLLGKDVHLMKNSYGKSESLYNTWLRNVRKIDLVK